MVEGAPLLREYVPKSASRVRIPLSPPAVPAINWKSLDTTRSLPFEEALVLDRLQQDGLPVGALCTDLVEESQAFMRRAQQPGAIGRGASEGALLVAEQGGRSAVAVQGCAVELDELAVHLMPRLLQLEYVPRRVRFAFTRVLARLYGSHRIRSPAAGQPALAFLAVPCHVVGLMSRCKCGWSYSLLSWWSRVRILPASRIEGTVAQSGRARSLHEMLSQRGINF